MTEVSSPRAVELAKRLKAAGAKMYGAFWCSHCFEQKQSFGKEAMAELPYVECYPDGYFKVGGLSICSESSGVCNEAGLSFHVSAAVAVT